MRLFIIGLDGTTWTVIDPLLKQGRLPNIARVIENGARGVSTAIEPAQSPIVWTSIASGDSYPKIRAALSREIWRW